MHLSWTISSLLLFEVAFCQNFSSSTTLSSSKLSCASTLPVPLAVPIRNISVENGKVRRGIDISYGSPPQGLAMIASCLDNNSYIFDQEAPCSPDASVVQCSTGLGGLFDEASSSSFDSFGNLAAPGLIPNQGHDAHANDVSGTDILGLSSGLNLTKFPVGVYRGNGGPHQPSIGLAKDSYLLKALIASNRIASSTFSFFAGWIGAEAKYQMDGSLVFGGYDQAKIIGPNVTLPFQYDQDCPSGYIVTVTDITANMINGTNQSLAMSSDFPIKACVKPDADYISLPQDMWASFVNAGAGDQTGRSTGPINQWTMLVVADTAFTGDLTISIDPGLDIRIPNHQLVVPDYDVNTAGDIYIKNSSNADILINSLSGLNDTQLPRFGKPFLSSAYLFVDNDHERFTLWQSNATTESNIVAVGSPDCNPAAPSATSSATAAPATTTGPRSGKDANKDAIVGGVVGGSAALAVGMGVVYLLIRRKRHQRRALEETEKAEHEPSNQSFDPSWFKAELATDQQPPHEMALDRDPGYRLPPYELTPRTAAKARGLQELPGTQSSELNPHPN